MRARQVFALTPFLGLGSAQWDPNYAPGHGGIVHLFEWHWDTIADECEHWLGPNKVGGVQVSPPNENRVVTTELMEDATVDRPWWERYQPVSYELTTRSGNEAQFKSMVDRCNAAGVRIYVDAVINHMVGWDASTNCIGTGGNTCDADVAVESFPAVPYDSSNFNDYRCTSSNGMITNYGDPDEVRNCQLVGLLDLDQSNLDTASKITAYLNKLVDMGVAGFRVDAMKHMWPDECLDNIFSQLHDLPADVFGPNVKPWVGSEVIDQGGEPIKANQYFELGTVTEFNYCFGVGNLAGELSALVSLDKDGENWGFVPTPFAFVFLNNHDNQRGHGGAGGVLTYKEPYWLKIGTAFMMTHPYGSVKRVMSSYYFTNTDIGPPDFQPEWDENCQPAGSVQGWVCEHRWPTILPLFQINGAVDPESDRYNWWDNWANQIAYSRGSSETDSTAFIAINGEFYSQEKMGGNFTTGLPSGQYTDVFSGNEFGINEDGTVTFCLTAEEDVNMIAFTLETRVGDFAALNEIPADCNTSNAEPNACIDCSCPARQREPCDAMYEEQCILAGCLWCPLEEGSKAPWCFIPGDDYDPTGIPPTTQPDAPPTCNVDEKVECGHSGITEDECHDHEHNCCWEESTKYMEPWCFHDSSWHPDTPGTCSVSKKLDCGYMGIDQAGCEGRGCCWEESFAIGDPWCFYKEK